MPSIGLIALLGASLFRLAAGLDLTVSTSKGNATSPLMYGALYEDIYHSGDGGLYAEMVQNRAFQGTTTRLVNNRLVGPFENLDYWHANNCTIVLDSSSPTVSSALPKQMRIDPQAGVGRPTVYNDGFGGFDVRAGARYNVSFYLRGTYNGAVSASFRSTTDKSILGRTVLNVRQSGSKWQRYASVLMPSASASGGQATFELTFNGTAQISSVYLQLVSVLPQDTQNNRANGVRADLAGAVGGMKPRFVRFPGGNNLEGQSAPYRLKWNETIGPLVNRPLFPGTWGYVNTQGFGLLEQIQWALDTGMTPILGLWAGLWLDGETIDQSGLGVYVQDALDELEFFLGSSSTKFGAMRAAYGYPDPFDLRYVEIGNEDYLNGGTGSYISYRFAAFHDAIKKAYPNLKIISSIVVNTFGTKPPAGTIQDVHEYTSADAFVSKFGVYDHTDRAYPVVVGEYAAISDANTPAGGELGNPTLQSATAEAVYFCGLERNADVIFGVAHGAMIKSLRDEPNNVALIKHDATSIVLSYSYYVFQLFSTNFGTHTVSVDSGNQTAFGPVYWSATVDDAGK